MTKSIEFLQCPETRQKLDLVSLSEAESKFSAVDPWLTPVYELGKKIFGQRESAHCHPLTKTRIEPLHRRIIFNIWII